MLLQKESVIERILGKSTAPSPEMMSVPFLFGVWLADEVWDQVLFSGDGVLLAPTAFLFFGNDIMIRMELEREIDETAGVIRTRTVAARRWYETHDGGVMNVRDEADGTDGFWGPAWGKPYVLKWYVTEDLGLVLDEGPWRRYNPATIANAAIVGFDREYIESLIVRYRSYNRGFIETFTLERGMKFVDAKFSAMVDGLPRPAPPV